MTSDSQPAAPLPRKEDRDDKETCEHEWREIWRDDTRPNVVLYGCIHCDQCIKMDIPKPLFSYTLKSSDVRITDKGDDYPTLPKWYVRFAKKGTP